MSNNRERWRFLIPGNAVGKARGRTFIPPGQRCPGCGMPLTGKDIKSVTTTPTPTRNFEALVKQIGAEHCPGLYERCGLRITMCLPVRVRTRKTMPDVLMEPLGGADFDNVLKSIQDAGTGVWFKSDRHVLYPRVRPRYIPADLAAHTTVDVIQCDWSDFLSADLVEGIAEGKYVLDSD